MPEELNKDQKITIDISSSAILKIIVILALLGFLYLIKEVLVLIFVAIILTSAFMPWVNWFKRRGIPRALGILIIYVVFLSLVGLVISLLIGPLTEQIGQLSANLPTYFTGVSERFNDFRNFLSEKGYVENVNQFLTTLEGSLTKVTGGIWGAITGIFGGLMSVVVILVITFYMTVQENVLKRLVWSITPSKYQPFVIQKITLAQRKLGSWFKGQLLLGLIIGLMCFIALKIVGVKYALVLALIAGIFELVPILGPILAGVVAVVLTIVTGEWMKAVFVVIIYIFIQQVENNWLVPKVMQKAVGLNPIISIVVLLIGAKLGGILGALLAIPLTVVISVFAQDLMDHKVEKSGDVV
jgi:predicted PurR-regulated permease PerM